jgi:hypothetical protein
MHELPIVRGIVLPAPRRHVRETDGSPSNLAPETVSETPTAPGGLDAPGEGGFTEVLEEWH